MHKFLRILTLLFSIMLTKHVVKCQDVSIIPPPPEAASFLKSIEVPVSMYTGLPNAGIDLHTIKTKELQIPIRLNYNARGIQVSEVASRVGIGWALQYGGMISRQIRGVADEIGDYLANYYYNEAFTSAEKRSLFHDAIVNKSSDEFPDQFFFDANGESGKFILDYNDAQVVLQNFKDIKIVPFLGEGEGGFESWVLTDRLGNKYFFGKSKDGTRTAIDYELSNQSFTFSTYSGMTSHGSAEDRSNTVWHLTEIETYLKERIEFFYEAELGIQYRRSLDKINYNSSPVDAVSQFSRVYSYQYQISEIKFPGGKVLFQKDSIERMDYTNTYPLKRVVIQDSLNNQAKSFELNHYYQRCDNDDNQLPYLKQIDTAANYRLFLSSINEKSVNGDTLPPYRFEYNPIKLPNRFSNSQDNWGYYNGKNNGHYLTFQSFYNNVNRQVDTALAGAGLLQKITYPTGGYVSFTYEQNKLNPPSFINSLLISPNNPTDTLIMGEAFFKDSIYYSNGMYSKEFIIGKNLQPLTTVAFNFVLPAEIDTSVNHYQVILERLDSLTSIYLHPPNTTVQLNLDSGRYRLMVIPSAGGDTTAFIASLTWTIILGNPHGLGEGEWYGAGKRIKRIEQKNTNTIVGYKEYEYLNDSGTTSGKMLGLPNFYFINKIVPVSGQYVAIPDTYGCIAGSPLSQLQGNAIGYSRVTEYYGDTILNLGKTVYEFTVDEDGGSYYQFPFHLPSDFEWLRGHPLNTKIYKRENNTYVLKRETINKYLYAGSQETSNLFSQPFVHADSGYAYQKDRNLFYLPLITLPFDPNSNPLNYTYEVYHLSAGSFDLASTTIKEYENGGEITSEVKYQYNYQKHYLSTGQTTINSKGDSSKSIIYYPLDIEPGNRTAAEQKLIDSNRVAVPVKQENVVKNNANTLLATTSSKTIYKDWGNAVVLPEYIQSSINGSSYENEIVFMKYNSNGSPLEVLTKAGVTESYIWGYNKQYPVARIVGSSYASAVSFVDTTMLHNASLYTDAQIRTELNKIRTGLASTNAFVSTYTYKPLVGITSVTDPRSQIQFYEYDAFNRLSVVKDYDGKILKKVCYNYWGQPDECTTTANFQPTGITRCKPCPSNNTYSTNVIQNQQKDINPNSPTYNQIQWVDAGTSSSCGLAVFVNEGSPYCEVNSSNQNTGNQLQLKRDMNPCSSTYYQTQVVLVGYNTGSCPLPPSCDSSNCTGDAYKCVNGTCEEGFRINTQSYYDDQLGTYVCVYHYEWSDDTWSGNYYEYNQFGHCFIFGW